MQQTHTLIVAKYYRYVLQKSSVKARNKILLTQSLVEIISRPLPYSSRICYRIFCEGKVKVEATGSAFHLRKGFS